MTAVYRDPYTGIPFPALAENHPQCYAIHLSERQTPPQGNPTREATVNAVGRPSLGKDFTALAADVVEFLLRLSIQCQRIQVHYTYHARFCTPLLGLEEDGFVVAALRTVLFGARQLE